MDHKELLALADAYLDGEVTPAAKAEIEAHLKDCAACPAELEARKDFSRRLKAGASYHEAPEGLARALAARLPESGKVVPLAAPAAVRSREAAWRPMALAASFLLAILLSGGTGYMASLPTEGDRITQQVVDDHVRSLLAGHLTDVLSTDQHTVKPWFNGHIDTAPPVHDFAAQGFALEGGRLDYLDHRPVAALVYRHGKHPINLFIWSDPSQREGLPSVTERQGYNIRHWMDGDISFWLVSDVEADALAQLETLVRNPL
jgi:anti-sigma factor RsiW